MPKLPEKDAVKKLALKYEKRKPGCAPEYYDECQECGGFLDHDCVCCQHSDFSENGICGDCGEEV